MTVSSRGRNCLDSWVLVVFRLIFVTIFGRFYYSLRFLPPFITLFHRFLVSTYYVPGSVN